MSLQASLRFPLQMLQKNKIKKIKQYKMVMQMLHLSIAVIREGLSRAAAPLHWKKPVDVLQAKQK